MKIGSILSAQRLPTVFGLSDQALVSATNFLLGLVLLRWLGLDGYGTFVLAWMGAQVASSLQQALLVAPLLNRWPTMEGEEANRLLHALDLQAIALAILSACAGGILAIVLGISPLSLALVNLTYLLHDWLRKRAFANQQNLQALQLDSLSSMLLFSGITALYFTELLTLSYTCFAIAFAYGLPVLVLFHKLMHRMSYKTVLNEAYKLRNFTGWLAGTAVLQWFSGNYFLVAAAALLGPAPVGALRMAQQLVGLLHVLFLAIENQVPVAAALRYRNGGQQDLLNYLGKVALYGGLASGLFLTLLHLFSSQIIRFTFGPELVPYAHLLQGMTWVYGLVFLALPLRIALRTLSKTAVLFRAYIFTCALSLVLATATIERFGAIGVIYGFLAMQLVMLFTYLWSLRKPLIQSFHHGKYRPHPTR